jgi:hypothetical protein
VGAGSPAPRGPCAAGPCACSQRALAQNPHPTAGPRQAGSGRAFLPPTRYMLAAMSARPPAEPEPSPARCCRRRRRRRLSLDRRRRRLAAGEGRGRGREGERRGGDAEGGGGAAPGARRRPSCGRREAGWGAEGGGEPGRGSPSNPTRTKAEAAFSNAGPGLRERWVGGRSTPSPAPDRVPCPALCRPGAPGCVTSSPGSVRTPLAILIRAPSSWGATVAAQSPQAPEPRRPHHECPASPDPDPAGDRAVKTGSLPNLSAPTTTPGPHRTHCPNRKRTSEPGFRCLWGNRAPATHHHPKGGDTAILLLMRLAG